MVENFYNRSVEDYKKDSPTSYTMKIKEGPWLTMSIAGDTPLWITGVENESALNDALIKKVEVSPTGRFSNSPKKGYVDSYAVVVQTNRGLFRVRFRR